MTFIKNITYDGGNNRGLEKKIYEEVKRVFKRKFVRQENLKDCGAACLLMMMRRYGGNYPLEQLRELMKIDKNGTTAFNLIEAAKKVGFDARGYKCSDYQELKCPSIAHVIMSKSYHHFVVIEKVDLKNEIITIGDPASGLKKYSFNEFNQIWTRVIITLYPIRKIDNIDIIKDVKKTISKIIYPYIKIFIFIFVLSIIYTIFNIVNTFYFKIIIDNTTLSIRAYFYLFLFFLFITIIKIITDFIRNRLLIYINKMIDKSLMENTFKHLLSLPWQYFNSRTTGDIIARLNDLSYVRELISKTSIILLVDLVLVAGSLIVMWFIDYNLFLVAILIFVIYFSVVYIFNRSVKSFVINNQEATAAVSSSLVETVTGINTIKNLCIEDQAYQNAMEKYNTLLDNNYLFSKKYNFVKTFKEFIAGGGWLTITLLGSLLITGNVLSIGDFIIFHFFLNFFLEPMKNIFEVEPLLRASSSALVRTSEFFNIEKENVNGMKEITDGSLSMSNLTFAYNGIDRVISDININVGSGEKIMMNGPSGSGKSTIAKMLMRYLDVKPQQILIDGLDTLDYSLSAIRGSICYISQDETIFTDSLYNNITLNRDIDDDSVTKVLNIACVDEILARHNSDCYMLLEENGANLSGGEKQRIMIARALLKKSQIFIFDESMSEMNVSLERSVLRNIFDNYADKTIIVISHRLDNADLYDRVIMVDNIKNKKMEGVAA